jgi:hypothetical protein
MYFWVYICSVLITLFYFLEGVSTQRQIRYTLILSTISSKFRTVIAFLIVMLKVLLKHAVDVAT